MPAQHHTPKQNRIQTGTRRTAGAIKTELLAGGLPEPLRSLVAQRNKEELQKMVFVF